MRPRDPYRLYEKRERLTGILREAVQKNNREWLHGVAALPRRRDLAARICSP